MITKQRSLQPRLTVSVPLDEGWDVGEVGHHHHGTHQGDRGALHTKADAETVEQRDLQLTGMDVSQMRNWRAAEQKTGGHRGQTSAAENYNLSITVMDFY